MFQFYLMMKVKELQKFTLQKQIGLQYYNDKNDTLNYFWLNNVLKSKFFYLISVWMGPV